MSAAGPFRIGQTVGESLLPSAPAPDEQQAVYKPLPRNEPPADPFAGLAQRFSLKDPKDIRVVIVVGVAACVAALALMVINFVHLGGGCEGTLCSYISLASLSFIVISVTVLQIYVESTIWQIKLLTVVYAIWTLLFALSTGGVIGHEVATYAFFGSYFCALVGYKVGDYYRKCG